MEKDHVLTCHTSKTNMVQPVNKQKSMEIAKMDVRVKYQKNVYEKMQIPMESLRLTHAASVEREEVCKFLGYNVEILFRNYTEDWF